MTLRPFKYGYGLVLGEINVIEEEAEHVREIFDNYIAGKSLGEISKELTKNGIPFYLGKCHWSKSSVSRILSEKKYLGEGEYPAIIAKEVYEKANAIKNSRQMQKNEKDEVVEYIKNVFYCDVCGEKMMRVFFKNNLCRWYCKSYCKRSKAVNEDELLIAISNAVFNTTFNDDYTEDKQEICQEGLNEILRCKNEISRLLSAGKINFNMIKKSVLECAALKFKNLKENRSRVYSDFVKKKVLKATEQKVVDKDFLESIVEKITVDADGNIFVRYITGLTTSDKLMGKREWKKRRKLS